MEGGAGFEASVEGGWEGSAAAGGSDMGSSGMVGMLSAGFESPESKEDADMAGEVTCAAGCLTCIGRF